MTLKVSSIIFKLMRMRVYGTHKFPIFRLVFHVLLAVALGQPGMRDDEL